MQSIIDFLSGRKTYIAAVITAGLNMAIIFGWFGPLTTEQIIAIEALLGALLGTTIRAAITKSK